MSPQVSQEDARKQEKRTSHKAGGQVPKDSTASAMKSMAAKDANSTNTSKLDMPNPPPDGSRSNAEFKKTTAGVGSGRTGGCPGTEKNSMREPVTVGSAVREDGNVLHKATE